MRHQATSHRIPSTADMLRAIDRENAPRLQDSPQNKTKATAQAIRDAFYRTY